MKENIGLMFTLFGLLMALVVHAVYLSYRFGRLSMQVETMWDFIMQRAQVEIVNKGWGELHSPLEITVNTVEMIGPLINEVIPFYKNLLAEQPKITDEKLFFELKRKFGALIAKHICVPHDLELGGCVWLLIDACKKLTLTKGDGTS